MTNDNRETRTLQRLARAVCIYACALLGACAPRPVDPAIEIGSASWGYAAERVNVDENVAQYCANKTSCAFLVSNQSFPGKADPSPGNDKGLIVSWKCGQITHKYQFAEGKMARLECK